MKKQAQATGFWWRLSKKAQNEPPPKRGRPKRQPTVWELAARNANKSQSSTPPPVAATASMSAIPTPDEVAAEMRQFRVQLQLKRMEREMKRAALKARQT